MWRAIERSALPLSIAAIIACVGAIGMVFFYAPVEATMGIAQKIFYVHVPAAMAAYAGFVVCSGASLVYLLRPSSSLDAAARAGAGVGMLFCLYVMISGPLWGIKAWGRAWTWDPQLTATFVLMMLYGGYVLFRQLTGDDARSRRIGAVLAVIACADIPLIHYAVRNWGGLHPVVEREGGGGLAPAMKATFSVSMLAFLLLFAALFVVAWMQRRFAQQIDEAFVELEDVSYELEAAREAAGGTV